VSRDAASAAAGREPGGGGRVVPADGSRVPASGGRVPASGGRVPAGERAQASAARNLGPRQLRPTDVKRLNRQWRRGTNARLALLLDSVTQPFNVGSIIRSAAAFGVRRVWLAGNSSSPAHPAARKTSLGTERLVSFDEEPSAAAAAKAAAAAGYRVVAIELAAGAVALHDAPLDGDVCLAFGNEDHGCSPALLAAAAAVAYIPQVGRVGSLNVAAAAAVALAEARRREWTGPSFSAAGPPVPGDAED
jgi:tRNA (guanosine-2'-O-)-methyltransferase